MNLQKFLELSSGKWFSQRTNYFLDQDKAVNSKADITIELISADHVQVQSVCQQHRIAPDLILGGTVQSWDNSVDWGKDKEVGSATVILVKDGDNETQGKLIRPGDSKVCGHFTLGEDAALTLVIETDELTATERQWFASDNLKMRTMVIQYPNGQKQTSFYSEIRKAAPKPDSE